MAIKKINDYLYSKDNSKPFKMIDNYVYLYHTNTYIILPMYPEQIVDTLAVEFNSSKPLMRTAPIQSYASSGPRTVQFSFSLRRDMMEAINYGESNANVELGDDYVDTMIKQLQAATLPKYSTSAKMVDPPLVAVRFGNEVFIKGVITSSLSVTYKVPILTNNKYANVTISFTVSEVVPYDADMAMADGSFRGLDTSLERNLFRTKNISKTTTRGG